MEQEPLHGIVETVPAFHYGTYDGKNKLVHRQYEGHQRIIAAFADPGEAAAYKKDKEIKRSQANTGGYYQIHEYSYRMATTVTYKIVPVDAMPGVLAPH